MWIFWIAAGGLAAAAAALIFARSAAAARAAAAPAEDPALGIYRRQLSDLDVLAGRGVMGPDELQAAKAEAGRRLLAAADTRRRPERPGGRRARTAVLAAAIVAAVAALGLYLKLGSPGLKDEPYQARLAVWRSDPSRLGAPQMAALLRAIAQQKPGDVKLYDYLGRAEMAAGDDVAAAQAFRKAIRLAPRRADLQAMLGEALATDAGGVPSPEARRAFQQALALDPSNAAARYYMGRADIAAGQVEQGLSVWRGLAADLPPNDAHRTALLAEIDAVGRQGVDTPTPPAPSNQPGRAAGSIPPAQLSFIRAMVAKQADDLNAHPDDPAGWARLVRSYGVLGDKAAQAQALAKAQKVFAGRPAALSIVQSAGSEAAGEKRRDQ
jgi:cytochrome c-type biogenesis protein CcmH